MSEYFFPNVSSKIYAFSFSYFFLQILQYEFHFSYKILYISFVFEDNCTRKFVMIFLCVYVLHLNFNLNKLYNFQFSVNNCDLDIT
jgi:hypothetical protein